ncbi:tetratricopeptide repeat protein [Aquisphaera insulae]|uniref:tetratricopeptide repeat protein n=1 Tax=Aquisphaera insulae TaxID=2712864 RepID=UPI0013EC0C41|nr:tetratricopeptide repeat protein [Aquisphaera insulae]
MPTPNELYDLASDLRDQGDKPGAIAKLEEAVAIDPNFTIGHGMLAKLYADIAEADKAIAHAQKVVQLEPDDAFSYTALSVICVRCGRIAEAEHAKAMAWQKQNGFED